MSILRTGTHEVQEEVAEFIQEVRNFNTWINPRYKQARGLWEGKRGKRDDTCSTPRRAVRWQTPSVAGLLYEVQAAPPQLPLGEQVQVPAAPFPPNSLLMHMGKAVEDSSSRWTPAPLWETWTKL